MKSRRKICLTLLSLTLFSFESLITNSQSLTYFFKKLPADCTPDLNATQRNTLLSNFEYILPGGDSLETSKYTIDTSSADKYLRCEYSFSTGQAGFMCIEMKKFKTNDGRNFIIFSQYGGVFHSYFQTDLRIFWIDGKNLIYDRRQKMLPLNVPISEFLKKGTPQEVKKRLAGMISDSYELRTDKTDAILFTIHPEAPSKEDEKWFAGYSYMFRWNGKSFEKQLTELQE